MLIGLNGRLKSGKDTTFEIIRDLYPDAERISFAEKLKVSAENLLKFDRETLDFLKNDEQVFLTLMQEGSSAAPRGFIALPELKMTMREFLQRYGTESHREVFGTDFWVDMALPLDTDHSNRILVVTDMRFPNEVARVRELGGITWKIERASETSFGAHPSEQDVDDDIDVFIDNNGTLEDLRVAVRFEFEVAAALEAEGAYT
jgi:hypothetical protein